MSDGRPVPPPKPGHYQSRSWRMDEDMMSPPPAGINHPPQHHDYTPHSNRSPEGMPPPYTPNQRSRDSLDFMGSPPYYTARNFSSGELLPPPPPKHSPPPPVPDENRDNYRNQPLNSPSRRQYKVENDSSGFDSGRGSSLDRNYDVRSYPKPGNPPSWPNVHVNGGGPYHNVPFRGGGASRREPIYPPPYDHHSSPPPPPTSLLDLSNRENRGSAFELYKKPDTRSSLGLPQMSDRQK